MATSYTSLLGLALPVTGELQGTWGTTVNDSITSLLDTAVAGTTTLSTDGDVTLSTTTGAANQARQAILLCSGARTAQRTITAPAQSKIYTVINATTGGFSVKLVGVGPTTGITIVPGESALVAWNGSDFIKVSNTGGTTTFTNVTVSGTTTLSGLTASTALALDASKNVVSVTNTGTGNNVLSASPTLTGTISAAAATLSSDLTLSAGTANGVLYLNGSKVATSGSALTFDGTGQLVVNRPSGSAGLILQSNDASTSYLFFGDQTSASVGRIEYDHGTNAMPFFANGSEQMRLTSTGLGIGTSSPATYSLAPNLVVATASSGGLTIRTGSSNYGGVFFADGTIGDEQYRGYIQYNHNFSGVTDYMFFGTAGGTKMTLDSSGNLGLGVTPSAWDATGAGGPVLQIKRGLLFGADTETQLIHNAYYATGDFRYIASSVAATRYQQTSGQHRFFTAPSGTAGNAISFTQAMTLDASGNLLVGTTSATGRVTVENTSAADGITIRSNGFNTNKTGVTNALLLGADYSTGLNYIVAGGSSTNTTLTFFTAATAAPQERARITSGGDLLVGTTSNTNSSKVFALSTASGPAFACQGYSGDVAAPAEIVGKFDNNTTTSQVFVRYTINNNAAGSGQINANGANAAAFGTYSDRRLKRNITDLPSQLFNIMSLRPVEFDFIESEGGGRQISFIAQEFEQVYPDAVGERDDGMKTLTGWGKTEARLVKAIQEQQALITDLRARVAQLERH